MESKTRIQQDISQLQQSIRKLSSGISQCGVDWKDEKFQSLKACIGQLAVESRRISETGRNCTYALRKFEEISSENY